MSEGFRDAAELRNHVMDAIEDHVVDRHRLIAVSDVVRELGAASRRAVEELIRDGSLRVVYEGNGLPTVVAPAYMFDEALRGQKKPDWLRTFALPERVGAEKALAAQRDVMRRMDVLERLLYATGEPLEEAVGLALEELGFDSVVVTHKPDDCDVRFRDGTRMFLAEAKGKGKQADKEDVLQLSGWVDDDVERGSDPDDVAGVLVINPFRHDPPASRAGPLTAEANRLAKRHKFGVWTSVDLFERVRAARSSETRATESVRHRKELLGAAYLEVI